MTSQPTLGLVCPVHGVQAAPAGTVRVARRVRAGQPTTWTLTGPCPAADCPVVMVLPAIPDDGVDLAFVTRLNAAGARVVNVTADAPATDIVPIVLPAPGGAA